MTTHKKLHNLTVRLSPILAQYRPRFFADHLQNPIFIIGLPRSGTTLLAELMAAAYREIAHWSEANHIWDPGWYPWKPSNAGHWPLEFDPVAFTARWWQEAEPRQQQIRAVFGAYQWLWRKTYFLNKSPFNTFRLPYLLQIFPQARFVHIVRNGYATVYSHASKLVMGSKLQEWPQPEQNQLAASLDDLLVWLAGFWQQGLREVAHQDEALKLSQSGLLLKLTYEELCADPLEIMERLGRFLALSPSNLEEILQAQSIRNQNHKYQQRLSAPILNRMSRAMEPELSRQGYNEEWL